MSRFKFYLKENKNRRKLTEEEKERLRDAKLKHPDLPNYKRSSKYRYSTGDTISVQVSEDRYITYTVDKLDTFLDPNKEYDSVLSKFQERDRILDLWNKKGFYHKNSKDGDDSSTIYETTHRKRRGENIYDLIRPWNENCKFEAENGLGDKQASIGTTSFTRNAVVIDVDDRFPYPGFDLEDKEEVERWLDDYCEKLIGLKPSKSIVNIEIKEGDIEPKYHYQIFYFLKEPIVYLGYRGFHSQSITEIDDSQRQSYMRLTSSMNKIFGGDEHFTGVQCKNPYGGDNLISYGSGERFYTVEELEEAVNNVLRVEEKIVEVPVRKLKKKLQKKERKEVKIKKIEPLSKSLKNKELSRNLYALNRIHPYAFKLEAQGKLNSYEDLIPIFEALERESLSINGKSDIEPRSNIIASCKGIYNFIKRVYDPNKVNKASISSKKGPMTRSEAAIEGNIIKKITRSLKVKVLVIEGLKNCEISKKMNVSRNTVTNLLKISIFEAFNTALNYIKRHKNSQNEGVRNNIEELKKLMKILKFLTKKNVNLEKAVKLIKDISDYYEKYCEIPSVFGDFEKIDKDFSKISLPKYKERVG